MVNHSLLTLNVESFQHSHSNTNTGTQSEASDRVGDELENMMRARAARLAELSEDAQSAAEKAAAKKAAAETAAPKKRASRKKTDSDS